MEFPQIKDMTIIIPKLVVFAYAHSCNNYLIDNKKSIVAIITFRLMWKQAETLIVFLVVNVSFLIVTKMFFSEVFSTVLVD